MRIHSGTTSLISLSVLLALAVALGACVEEDSAEGECTGTMDRVPVQATLDPSSDSRDIWATSCAGTDRTVFDLDYGSVRARGVTRRVSLLAGERTYPAPPSAEADFVESWTIEGSALGEPPPEPTRVDVRLEREGSSRIDGAFVADYADGSRLECTFNLPDLGEDEGEPADCGGGGGGGGGDWDD